MSIASSFISTESLALFINKGMGCKQKVINAKYRRAMLRTGQKYDGNPCQKCGSTLRLVSNRKCIRCEQERVRLSPRHKVYMAQYQRKWKYGITQSAYDDLLSEQERKCAICSRLLDSSSRDNTACVDHNHSTGKVRGLLCRPCNQAIGNFQDNPELCRIGAKYLEGRRN